MNLFLADKDIVRSMQALDDSRLKKQIVECKQMVKVALGFSTGYQYHPVVLYYKQYPYFVVRCALLACREYEFRVNKKHHAEDFFNNLYNILDARLDPKHFYCEGLKTDPNHIRTTENTVELFRNKLSKKWDNDKYIPRWTNRCMPDWYKTNREDL